MNATFLNNYNELEVLLYGEIDHHCAKGLGESIDFKILRHEPEVLVLDFGGVSFMDSSGLAIVMGRYQKMKTRGGRVELRHLCGGTKKIFEMAKIRRFVKIKEE